MDRRIEEQERNRMERLPYHYCPRITPTNASNRRYCSVDTKEIADIIWLLVVIAIAITKKNNSSNIMIIGIDVQLPNINLKQINIPIAVRIWYDLDWIELHKLNIQQTNKYM